MSNTTRRTFLKQTGLGVAGAAAAARLAVPTARVLGANERVNVGVIGCGGRGSGLARVYHDQPDAHVAYVCDVDAAHASAAKNQINADKSVDDLRKVLDDKGVDAVVIATPDHWHTPAAILALDAGKHVYVEKPCSHNVREGRLLVEAAARNKRIVQHGTQSRSSPHVIEAIKLLRDGAIGDVLVAKAINSQLRGNIGKGKPADPPANLNYDLWVGPAPMVPYYPNHLHYNWHWFYNFGTGDIGNDGVHEVDIARWGLGVETQPSGVSGFGAKLFFDDDQQFPDTYVITYEYPGGPGAGQVGSRRLLIYEQRIWSPYNQEGGENCNVFYGTKGVLQLAKGRGLTLMGERNKIISQKMFPLPVQPHVRNFIDAIINGTPIHTGAPTAHLSASLSHLGNIVARVGRSVRFDPKTEQVIDDDEANNLVHREYRKDHWAVPKGV